MTDQRHSPFPNRRFQQPPYLQRQFSQPVFRQNGSPNGMLRQTRFEGKEHILHRSLSFQHTQHQNSNQELDLEINRLSFLEQERGRLFSTSYTEEDGRNSSLMSMSVSSGERSMEWEEILQNSPRNSPKLSSTVKKGETLVNHTPDVKDSTQVTQHAHPTELKAIKPNMDSKETKSKSKNSVLKMLKPSFVKVTMFASILLACYFRDFIYHLHFNVCLNQPTLDVAAINQTLQTEVFGQHIVQQVVPKHLSQLMDVHKNDQLLFLVFAGWTGVGKNYVSSIIGNHIATETTNKIIVPLEYSHGCSENELKDFVLKNVVKCTVNLFIIDEPEKGLPCFLNNLPRDLEALLDLEMTDTKVIIIFLTSSGAQNINGFIIEKKIPRKAISQQKLLDHLSITAPELWFIQLHKSGTIDDIVPFLPLEKSHVKNCIETEIKKRKGVFNENSITDVLNEIEFFSVSDSEYSKSGCRRVPAKVDLHL